MRTLALVAVGCVLLGACSSGTTSGSRAGGAGGPVSTIFGLAPDTRIDVNSASLSYNKSDNSVTSHTGTFLPAQNFWLKSKDANQSGDVRRIMYGKPYKNFHPRRLYSIPLILTANGGETIGTGTATFSGADVESGVTSRTITITDVELQSSVFGLFSTTDAGTRGDFFDVHAYAGGIAATNLPANATYTGSFLGDVVSQNNGGTATRLTLPANLAVDFGTGTVTGNMGSDIALSGTISGTGMTGTATISSSATALTNGSTGAFAGGFFGTGGREAAGALGISDTSGATAHELVGAFGATKN